MEQILFLNRNIEICSFTYHEVTDFPEQSGFQRRSALPYKHSVNEFLAHLDIFSKCLIPVTTLDQIDFSKSEKHILLTFDDGGISALKVASLLEERNWRGHFFITTSMIGKPCFMKSDDILDLHKRGHIIGVHSHTHPSPFYDLSYTEMLNEWNTSKLILENIIGEKVNTASIPGGDMDRNTQLSSYESGLSYLFCSEPFIHPKQNGNILLGRICPKKGTPIKRVEDLADFRGFFWEMAIRQIKNIIKVIVYPIYRQMDKFS